MKTKEEIKKWLLENCVNEFGDLNLSSLDFRDFDGDVILSGMKVKNNLFQSHQSVGGCLYQSSQFVCQSILQNYQMVGGNLHQNFQVVKGNLFQDHQEVNGNLDQNNQNVKGCLFQEYQIVAGVTCNYIKMEIED